jgi:hypothetical protein
VPAVISVSTPAELLFQTLIPQLVDVCTIPVQHFLYDVDCKVEKAFALKPFTVVAVVVIYLDSANELEGRINIIVKRITNNLSFIINLSFLSKKCFRARDG